MIRHVLLTVLAYTLLLPCAITLLAIAVVIDLVMFPVALVRSLWRDLSLAGGALVDSARVLSGLLLKGPPPPAKRP